MRTVEKEKTIYTTVYVANDGKEFFSKEECEKYEQTAWFVIQQMFDSLEQQKTKRVREAFNYPILEHEEDITAINITNATDLEIVNRWVKAINDAQKWQDLKPYGTKDIGTIQLIGFLYDTFYQYGSLEDTKKCFCDGLDSLANKLTEKEKSFFKIVSPESDEATL